MGMFDDLIPAQQANPAGGGMFDDLIPSFDAGRFDTRQEGAPDVSAIMKPGMQRAAEAHPAAPMGVGQALGRGAAQGATLGLADELSGAAAASPIPGNMQVGPIPNAVDAIAGGARLLAEKVAPSWFGTGGGQAYDAKLEEQRALNRKAEEDAPWTYLGGQVAGGIALPFGAAGQAATRGQALVQGAKAGGALGAAYGFGQGEGFEDRATKAATGGALGAVAGGALGAAFGKAAPAAGQRAGQEVVEAAERIGVPVPRAIASDSTAIQRSAQGVRNVPFAGEPMVRATTEMVEGLGRAADDVTGALGSGDRLSAGNAASTAIKDWITGGSRKLVNRAYDDVEKAIAPNVVTPLDATRKVAADIMASRSNSMIQGESRALAEITPALQSQGLNYAGIKGLRTRIGEMLDNGILPDGMSGGELKRIYGALSDDLKSAAERAGGARGLALFERANRLNAAVAGRRESLAKIVGVNGDAPAEAVFDKLLRYAGQKGGADMQRLAQARRAIGDDWGEISSAVVSRLGRDAEGQFSPQRFVTDWGKLSEAGKSVLFSDRAHRQALDDIYKVSSRAAENFRKFGNPSGTAQNVTWAGVGAGMLAAPVTTISSVIGGNVASRVLAQPASAKSMANLSRVASLAARYPGAGAAKAITQASRQFAAEVGEKLGVSIDPAQIVRALAGPRAAPASDGQFNQEE